jgi:outer membrane receptor protein involved in Fe transport
MNSRRAQVAGFLACLLFTAAAAAQVDTGAIVGTVRDTSEAVLPDAGVTIRNTATGVVTRVRTNELGRYASPPLQPAPYTVTAELPGFQRTQTSITLTLNQRAVVDLTLQVGSVELTVTVTSEAPLLQAETSTLSTLKTEQAVKETPLNGRNFAMLLGLSAGVTPAVQQRGGPPLTATRGETANSVNGMGFRANRFLVDGLDNTENHNGQGILIHPPLEAIQEINVQSSVPSAEFGRGGANVNVRLKSGTRDLHGTLFEFHRNAALDAKNFFDSPTLKIPPFVQNQFGFVIGGPVMLGAYNRNRDKTFFLFNYEGLRNRQAQTFRVTTPLAAMRQGDFSQHPNRIYDPATARTTAQGVVRDPYPNNTIPTSQQDAAGRNILGLFPDPNLPGLANNYSSNPPQPTDSNNFDIKIDQNFTDRDMAFFRYSQHTFNQDAAGSLPAPAWGSTAAGLSRYPVHQFVMSYTHLFSPTLVNEARAGVGRLFIDGRNANYGVNVADQLGIPGLNSGDDPIQSGMPQITISGLPVIGDSGFRPALVISENWQYSDNLSWYRGAHTFKFGGEYLRRRYNLLQTTAAHGLYSVTGQYTQNLISSGGTGIGAADVLLGAPTNGNINALAGMRGFRRPELYLYAQDDWKITPSLTLNYGVRYEVFYGYPYTEVYDRQANFLPDRADVFVVNTPDLPERSGTTTDFNNFGPRIGLAYKIGNQTVIRAAYGIFYQAESIPETNLPGVNPPFNGSAQFANDRANFAAARRFSQGFPLAPSLVFPTAGAALFSIEREFDIPYASQWNFGIQRQLPKDMLLTANYVGTKGTGLILAPNINQPAPGPGAVNPRRRFPGFGNINHVQSSGSSNYHSMQLTAEKRLSGNLGFSVAYTFAKAIENGGFIGGRQDINDLRAQRGRGGADQTHRFLTSWHWIPPFGRGQKYLSDSPGWVNAVLGGWQLNGINSLYTGLPFTVNSAINTLNGSGGQRADRIGDGRLPESERTLQRFFDINAFAVPGQYIFGNSGVNILSGPSTVQFDFSAFKRFFLDDQQRYRFEFRGEFFNVFNTPQFNTPASNIGNPNAGTISSAGSKTTFQRTSRQIQLALKFFF